MIFLHVLMALIENRQKIYITTDITNSVIKIDFYCQNLIFEIHDEVVQLQMRFSCETILDNIDDCDNETKIKRQARQDRLEKTILAARRNYIININMVEYHKFYAQVFEKLTSNLIADRIRIKFQDSGILYQYLNDHFYLVNANCIELEMERNIRERQPDIKLIEGLQNILDICFIFLKKEIVKSITLYEFPYTERYFIDERISALESYFMLVLSLDGNNPGKITQYD